jgi:hypothetical protein
MTGFEFLFTFYGLMLGLAVANATSNLGEMWRGSPETRVGLSPLLMSAFILLAAAQQWTSLWGGRESVRMGPWEIVVSMAMALPYIFISSALVPSFTNRALGWEGHYLAHRRVLMPVLAIPPLVSLAYNGSAGHLDGLTQTEVWTLVGYYGVRAAIPLALAFTANPWAHRVGLTLLLGWALAYLFA